MTKITSLQYERLHYFPKIPLFLNQVRRLQLKKLPKEKELTKELKKTFPCLSQKEKVILEPGISHLPTTPLKVGILFSGGPAAGGHNVISGAYDLLKQLHPDSQLVGFFKGMEGLINNHCQILTEEIIYPYRNQGGFDLLGTSRTKIKSLSQFQACLKTVTLNKLQGLIIIGGDDSNTNAAFLAEYFLQNNSLTNVIGVPKTIDGDLKNSWIESSFGFDSAAKTYAATIGSLAKDAKSQAKYYFFVKVMGRTASHLVLECALKTAPQLALIGEEILDKKLSLEDIIADIVNLVKSRALINKNYGVILIPEGLIEFIPEMQLLIKEINHFKQKNLSEIKSYLTDSSLKIWQMLTKDLQAQFFLSQDPHGNTQVSKIETEKLLLKLVEEKLKKEIVPIDFNAQSIFLGYEGRACLPSNFDANYCYNLGQLAALLIQQKQTGLMATLTNLTASILEWQGYGVPLTWMLDLEKRGEDLTFVIKKGLVDLEKGPFSYYQKQREKDRLNDPEFFPGPIQFSGAAILTDNVPLSLTHQFFLKEGSGSKENSQR